MIRLSELCQSFPELTIVGISNSSPDVKRTEALLAQMDARDDNENTSLYKRAIAKTRAWLRRLDDKRAAGLNVRVKEGHVPATVGMCGSPRSASVLDPKISSPQVLEAGGSFKCLHRKHVER